MRRSIGLLIAVVLFSGVACRKAAEAPKKIPITTSSAEAQAAYLKARGLVENMRVAEARPLLDEAISKDPNFALAHLLRAQTASSTDSFLNDLKAAVAAAGKASEGEQLLIRAQETYINGDNKARGEYLTKLVAAYPNDERAHWFFGINQYSLRQYDSAIAEFQKAIQLAPDYAPAHNQLGYAYREVEKYPEAEAAFRKYAQLIPNEPNPHDSLAELLLKMGRFSESTASYQKALSLDAGFINAYLGIAANLMYQEKHKEALDQLQKGFEAARDDGERQRMLRAMAVANLDEGKPLAALAALTKESALAEQIGDKAAMSQVTFARGELLVDTGKAAEAKTEFAKSLELLQQSAVPERRKEIVELYYHGGLALVAAVKKDFADAAKEAEAMRAGIETMGNPNDVRRAHEVLGIVALRQMKYDDAITHLNQADLSSPYTMFQLAKAYAGKKDAENAKAHYQKAATAYTLPELRYAMVRHAALKAAGK
ncbi:MAG: tetratricopeptide repeat protein [Bryobacteraceae bacterium]